MRAIALTEFGDPDVLSWHELPDPPLGPDQVRIELRAAGVNPVDCKIRRGYLRGLFPHHTPLIPGWDAAGVVNAVGPASRGFAVGDAVMAYARKDTVEHGTYSELLTVADWAVAPKPAILTFAQAAGLPLAGLTALQALRAAGTRSGDTVLIHAAAGGVGHLAVQIARALGAARVIGTASPTNHEFLSSLGAEPIAYGPDLPERLAEQVDVVIDLIGGEALAQSVKLVRDPARHVSVVDANQVLAQGGKYVFVRPDGGQLTWLGKLAEAGTLRVEVTQELEMAEAAQAHRLVEAGHVRGKVVLTI
jgi:NADPH:quinone reductase-like Zn-dependent oxidoreductase